VDILGAVDRGDLAMLTLLDLFAAFDAVDHKTLVHRLEMSYDRMASVTRYTDGTFRLSATHRSQFVRSLWVNIIDSKGRPVRCPTSVGLGTDPFPVYSGPDRSS